MFDLKSAVPELIRRDIEWGENNLPEIPREMPEVVAADPSWKRRWLSAREFALERRAPRIEEWNADRRRRYGRLLASSGWGELRRIVLSCNYAAARYEMPASWRACLIKQAYEDMQHAASFITRGCRYAEADYWSGFDARATHLSPAAARMLERDLGGFFAVVGLHTEAYPAEDGGYFNFILAIDPVLARWSTHEIEQEAGHLSFLFPAMREYFNSGTPAECDAKKRQLVADNEELIGTMLRDDHAAMERFLIERLGLERDAFAWPANIPERTRHIYHLIGIEQSYWPEHLRG